MSDQTTALYEEYGIKEKYDSQQTYGKQHSYYGKGNYPPDWSARRNAVWERQKYQCGRCGIYKGDAAVNEVHHIIHLEQGGSNALDNLVGLCGDCHALMHPDLDVLNGDYWESDLFPDDRADDRVAVVRKPRGNDELKTDVERLGEVSSPDTNANAVTDESVPTSAEIARQARTSLHQILLEYGFVPRTTDYHRISVHPKPVDVLAAITTRGVDLTARSDGKELEVEKTGDDQIDVYLTADSSLTEFELKDPAGETYTDEVSFDDPEGCRLRVEKPISAPPLTAATAPQYTADAIQYFGWESLKIGAIPGLILAFLLPSLVPAGGSILGIAGLVLLIGLLLRLPSMYQDIAVTPSSKVVNERTESE